MANHCASRFGFLGHASLPARTGAGLVNVIIDMPPGTLAEDGDPLDVLVIAEDHGRHFRPTGHGGPDEAQRMLGAAEQRFKKTRE